MTGILSDEVSGGSNSGYSLVAAVENWWLQDWHFDINYNRVRHF